MLKNYIKIAWRNLIKHKLDSAISIGGLAVGIACCILLVLFVHFEWSFDDFHTKADRIYRVVTETTGSEGTSNLIGSTPYQLGPELKTSYPELEQVVRVTKNEVELERDQNFQSQQVLFADSAFFELFSFGILQGSPESVLDNPGNIVLTESKARQLFGTTNALGKEVGLRLYDDVRYYRIAGIAADPPANSSISFEMVLPIKNYRFTKSSLFRKFIFKRWDISMSEAFVLLNRQSAEKQLESKLPGFVKEHYGEAGENVDLMLQPMAKIYLNPEIDSSLTQASSPVYSWILAGIAVVVLVIACINFMSLTLSRSSARSNEIGIRKAAGAERLQLGFQFLGEALITCFLALILGVFLAELALPYLRELVGKPVPFSLFGSSELIFSLVGLLIASALFTGLYPAVVMSRKSASESLMSSRVATRIPSFVKGLIVIQFALSMVFVSSAFIMYDQMDYILEKDLGFDGENVVVINPSTDTEQAEKIYNVFEREARMLSQVRNISATFSSYGTALLTSRVKPEENQSVEVGIDVVDPHFIETLRISLEDGRNFSVERPGDLENGALVNRVFVESMGWQHPIGKEIPPVDLPEDQQDSGNLKQTLIEGKKVIGVVDNFNYESLYNQLKPLVLVSNRALGGGVGTIWVKIGGERIPETLSNLESIWKKASPAEPFVYSFLDDQIRQQYENEQRWREIVDISSMFTIVLACFGLFGLAALAAQRRVKEIGIRKVFGATISSIVGLLSKDFLKLVVLGFVIAVPIAWYAMNQWLADFAYRIEIGPGIFALAGGAALFIALATVSWQSVRAALANPVESLRNE